MRKLVGLILVFLLLLTACSNGEQPSISKKEYEHIPYVSDLSQEECFVCGENPNHPTSSYWGEDNVGILNLNTFEVLYIEINRYDDTGRPIEEPAGTLYSNGMIDTDSETYVHAYVDPDHAYAQLQLTGVKYEIDRNIIQGQLCQRCLDSSNGLFFTT